MVRGGKHDFTSQLLKQVFKKLAMSLLLQARNTAISRTTHPFIILDHRKTI